jgi:hypothetical protein
LPSTPGARAVPVDDRGVGVATKLIPVGNIDKHCMASANDEVLDDFLSQRGHATERPGWERSYNKKQCPDCGGLHDESATACSVCGWSPRG